MLTFEPETFGHLNAEDYDDTQDPGTAEAAATLISEIAGQTRILELAIGTGRVALPLIAKGHDVSGIEASEDMVEKMRSKPGGAEVDVLIGDMADVGLPGPFGHIYLVYNTLFNLTSQDAQIRLFANVADRLAPGGTFLIEAFVPDFTGYNRHQRVDIRKLEMETLWLSAVTHDPVAQRLDHQRLRVGPEGKARLVPLQLRYAYPAEIDLMARLAGLELSHRWGGWDKRTFDTASQVHISVYGKP